VTGLIRRGNQVVLVSFGGLPAEAQSEWTKCLPELDFRPTAFKLEWMQESAADLESSAEFLLRVITETKPDLLHSNQYCYGALRCDVPKVVVAHSDVVSWWIAVHGQEPKPGGWIDHYRETVTRGVEGADAVVGVTRWMLGRIERHYAHPRLGLVIYNGRSRDLFLPETPKEEFALSVGRLWDQAKQMNLLSEISSPIPLFIAGAEEHPEGRAGGAKHNALGVKFLGVQQQEEMRELYACAAVYVAASCYEPFGLAALEAALSGCAILVNDIETFREVWGDAALYFERNSAQDLERKLYALQSDKGLREHYSQRVLRRAGERYAADRMVREYLDLYKVLCGSKVLVA
jgi:glycosyltransferase involved in cell wall biosynthesis